MRAPIPPYSSSSALFAQMSQIPRHTHLRPPDPAPPGFTSEWPPSPTLHSQPHTLFSLLLLVLCSQAAPVQQFVPRVAPGSHAPSSCVPRTRPPERASRQVPKPPASTGAPASPSCHPGPGQRRQQERPLQGGGVSACPRSGRGSAKGPRSTAEALAQRRSLCFPACTDVSKLTS